MFGFHRVRRETYHSWGYLLGMYLLVKGWPRLGYVLLRLLPTCSPSFTLAQGYAASILGMRERFAKAEAQGRRALRTIQRRGCPHPPSHVQFVRDLGAAVREQGRRVESLAIFEEAVELADRLMVDHPDQRRALAWEKGHTLQAIGSTLVLLENYPAAVAQYREARATYRREPDLEEVGHAEVLTNLAHAFACAHDLTSAEYALLEASEIARRTGNTPQLDKITAVATHWDISAVAAALGGDIAGAAARAVAAGQYSTGYIRHCIAAKRALESGDLEVAAGQVAAARLLERRLDPNELHPPRLRNMEASILERRGASTEDVFRVLVDGAHEWVQRLTAVRPGNEDFRAIADDLHDHFRRLARFALALDRRAESLAAFEIGRALAWAADHGPRIKLRPNSCFGA